LIPPAAVMTRAIEPMKLGIDCPRGLGLNCIDFGNRAHEPVCIGVYRHSRCQWRNPSSWMLLVMGGATNICDEKAHDIVTPAAVSASTVILACTAIRGQPHYDGRAEPKVVRSWIAPG